MSEVTLQNPEKKYGFYLIPSIGVRAYRETRGGRDRIAFRRGVKDYVDAGGPSVIVTVDERDPRDLVRAVRDAGFEPALISVQDTAALDHLGTAGRGPETQTPFPRPVEITKAGGLERSC